VRPFRVTLFLLRKYDRRLILPPMKSTYRESTYKEIGAFIGEERAYALTRKLGGIEINISQRGRYTPMIEEAIGEDATRRLIEAFGGCRVAIPKNYRRRLHERNECIKRDRLEGMSSTALTLKYNITARQIRRIVNGKK